MTIDPERPSTAEAAAIADASWSGWYALAVLIAATLFSVADRYIFSLLAEPIRVGLQLSDLQLGLLQGVGLSLFAAVVSFPLGWLADRYDRRWILAGCIAVWSAGVFACGLATTFDQLLIASAVVGGGEAGLIPIVYALIPELFRNAKRAFANALYAATTKLGASLGIAACAWLVFAVDHYRPSLPAMLQTTESWRLSFFGAALPGPLMIALILTIRIPRRLRTNDRASVASGASGRLLPFLRSQRATIVPFLLSMGLITFGFVAIAAWITVVLIRTFGVSPQSVGAGMGASNLSGSLVGFLFALYGLRYFASRFDARLLPIRVLWLTAAASALTSALLLLATTPTTIYIAQGVQTAFTMAAFMVYPTAIQDLGPPWLRSRIASLSYVMSVVFAAASPVAVGLLSDRLKAVPNGLLISAVTMSVVALTLAAVLLRRAEHGFLGTIAAARGETGPAGEVTAAR